MFITKLDDGRIRIKEGTSIVIFPPVETLVLDNVDCPNFIVEDVRIRIESLRTDHLRLKGLSHVSVGSSSRYMRIDTTEAYPNHSLTFDDAAGVY